VVESGRPLFSIGAVARMLDLTAATLRTWEARYGLVTPERSGGGQRLYSRDQVEQLRYVRRQVEAGCRPAEAHRLLSERLARGDRPDVARMRVLLARSGPDAARVLGELVGGRAPEALRACTGETPVVLVDPGGFGLEEISDRLRASGAEIVPLDS
jgi:DNA-binding transcriptional MerR regulator